MFYGQFELDKVLYQTFFQNKKEGFFVECGAFDGLTESTCKFFEESMGWTGMNIEPTPYAYNKLIQNRPHCINLQYALSSTNGKATFTNAIHPSLGLHFGNGSLNHTSNHKDELVAMGCNFETFEVECIRFDNLHQTHNIKQIDLFVLDVEGHECNALDGILSLPQNSLPLIFCIEHSITGSDKINKMLKPYYTFHSKHAHNAFFVRIN
ncbi:MAG TPA: FkbM family methyltransferase [Candidatus Saccharimonadia bacterium]|nr:FkbM family methyltransferase [Candidatus Saccharimonadia bacterium]